MPVDRFYEALNKISGHQSVGIDLLGQIKNRLKSFDANAKDLNDLVGSEDRTPEAKSSDDFKEASELLNDLEEKYMGEFQALIEEASTALSDMKCEWWENMPSDGPQGYDKPSDYIEINGGQLR